MVPIALILASSVATAHPAPRDGGDEACRRTTLPVAAAGSSVHPLAQEPPARPIVGVFDTTQKCGRPVLARHDGAAPVPAVPPVSR